MLTLQLDSLTNFCLFSRMCQGTYIPSGNPEFCNLSLLDLLLGLLGLGRGLAWFAMRAGPRFPHPRGSQTQNITCDPSSITTSTAYLGFWVQLRHKDWHKGLMEWLPCLASTPALRFRGNLVFLLGPQHLVGSERDAATRQRTGLKLELPSWVDEPHLPIMWNRTIWWDSSQGICLSTRASPHNSGPAYHLT